MANFYTDNPDLKHHLNHPLMRKIVELKERNYTDAEKYDYAPFIPQGVQLLWTIGKLLPLAWKIGRRRKDFR